MANLVTWDVINSTAIISDNFTMYGSGMDTYAIASLGKITGKWYWEFHCTTAAGYGRAGWSIGGGLSPNVSLYYHSGKKCDWGSETASAYGDAWGVGDTIGFAYDLVNNIQTRYKNGVPQPQLSDVPKPPGACFPLAGTGYAGMRGVANFGATPFDIATSNPSAWQQLVSEGYLPYDCQNADWFFTSLSLIQSSTNLLTHTTTWEIIGTTSDNLPTLFPNGTSLSTLPQSAWEELYSEYAPPFTIHTFYASDAQPTLEASFTTTNLVPSTTLVDASLDMESSPLVVEIDEEEVEGFVYQCELPNFSDNEDFVEITKVEVK